MSESFFNRAANWGANLLGLNTDNGQQESAGPNVEAEKDLPELPFQPVGCAYDLKNGPTQDIRSGKSLFDFSPCTQEIQFGSGDDSITYGYPAEVTVSKTPSTKGSSVVNYDSRSMTHLQVSAMQAAANAAGNVGFASAQTAVNASFNKREYDASESKRAFAQQQITHSVYTASLGDDTESLRAHLRPEYKEILDNESIDADEAICQLPTHFIYEAVFGGRVFMRSEQSVTSESHAQQLESQLSANVEAQLLSGASVGANAQRDTAQDDKASLESKVIRQSVQVEGGETAMEFQKRVEQNSDSPFSEWAKTVKYDPVVITAPAEDKSQRMVHIVGIWALAATPQRAEALEQAFYRYVSTWTLQFSLRRAVSVRNTLENHNGEQVAFCEPNLGEGEYYLGQSAFAVEEGHDGSSIPNGHGALVVKPIGYWSSQALQRATQFNACIKVKDKYTISQPQANDSDYLPVGMIMEKEGDDQLEAKSRIVCIHKDFLTKAESQQAAVWYDKVAGNLLKKNKYVGVTEVPSPTNATAAKSSHSFFGVRRKKTSEPFKQPSMARQGGDPRFWHINCPAEKRQERTWQYTRRPSEPVNGQTDDQQPVQPLTF